MKRHSVLFLTIILAMQVMHAQADIAMSTSWYNRSNYNPASIARLNYLYFFSNVRQQWINVVGAPKSLNIQLSGFNYNRRSAFGFSLTNDNIGFSESINPMLSYAYRINKNEEWSLSFGLSAGVFYRNLNTDDFNPENPADPILNGDFEKLLTPDANVGMEFQSRHFIAGVSGTHLFSISNSNPYYLISNHRYGYLIFKSTESEVMNVYTGLQFINRANILVTEINASLRFKSPTGLVAGSRELFDVGVTYRTSKQLSAMVGVNLSSDLRIGYSFDQTFLPGYNSNSSHEIVLEYRIPLMSARCPVCNFDDSWYR